MVSPRTSKQKAKKPRQARDAELTKAQILNIAEREFARYGLAGARIKEISSQTGVVKAMIYYYFESKEGLYQAVMYRIATELDAAFQPLATDDVPIEAAIEASIRAGIAYGAAYPHRGMLWFYEAIQNQGQYGQASGWQQSFLGLTRILERGVSEGVLRSLDPFLTTINILGVCTFYFNAHENIKYLDPSRQLLSPEMIEKQTQAAIDLILTGIKA